MIWGMSDKVAQIGRIAMKVLWMCHGCGYRLVEELPQRHPRCPKDGKLLQVSGCM